MACNPGAASALGGLAPGYYRAGLQPAAPPADSVTDPPSDSVTDPPSDSVTDPSADSVTDPLPTVPEADERSICQKNAAALRFGSLRPQALNMLAAGWVVAALFTKTYEDVGASYVAVGY